MEQRDQTPATDPGAAEVQVLSLEDRVRLLDSVQAFVLLPRPALERIAALMQEEHFQAGHAIVTEGEPGDRLYVIVEGSAEATATTRRGRAVLQRYAGRGSLFGELALLNPENVRHATVTAGTPVTALTLTRTAFADLLEAYPLAHMFLTQRKRLKLVQKFWQVNVLYRLSFQEPRRERLFLSSTSFLVTFGIVRAIVHAIRTGKGPFRDVKTASGKHIHHLVWGILLLLAVGYTWLIQIGTGVGEERRWMRMTAIFYGIGAALTLDEFALWLNLEDVYWGPEGRRSIDAVILFGSFLVVGNLGDPFWRALFRFFVLEKDASVDSAVIAVEGHPKQSRFGGSSS